MGSNFGEILNTVIGAVGGIISGLKGAGVNLGSVGDFALKEIEATQIDEANYLAGQAVPVGTLSYQGKPGTIVVVADGGTAAQSLGL